MSFLNIGAIIAAQVKAAQDAQLAAMRAAQAPVHVDQTGSIMDLHSRIEGVQRTMADLQGLLNSTAPAAARAINDAWDTAMKSLHDLTGFFDGDYDSKDSDDNKRQALLAALLSSFQAVEDRSETAFNNLSNIQQRALDIRSTQLTPLKNQIGSLKIQTANQLTGLQQAIGDANQNILNLQNSMNQAQMNMNTLRDRKRSAEQAATAADVGLGIATFGIWNLAGAIDSSKSPSAVIGIQNDIDACQRSIDSINNDLARQNGNIANLLNQKTATEHNLAIQQNIQNQIPGIEVSVDDSIKQIDQMTKSVLAMKETAAQLVDRSMRLRDEATTTAHEDFLKKEYISSILDICLLAAVDPSRSKSISEITGEIKAGYAPKPIPTPIQQQITQVDSRCKQLQGSA